MPMDLVNASSLAPLLPLLPAEQLFQYTASLERVLQSDTGS